MILGNEYIVIKEGYFALSSPHLSLFVCSPVYRRSLPSEKIGASFFQKGGGGSTQAICVPFCLGFVCTYLNVLKLSVFEKIRVHSLRIQIFFAQTLKGRTIRKVMVGEGNFRAAGIFFRYQTPCMNSFQALA